MITILIIAIFIIGLIMFITKLPALKKAVKDGWKEGQPKKK